MATTGTITSVQRMSLHDGPGIRSTVFLKGCNLRCKWCHNPETWSSGPQHQFVAEKCISCGCCIAVCPEKCLSKAREGIRADARRCRMCRECESACPAEALSITGRVVTSVELVERLMADSVFYEHSGGGVTISGGEPLLQKEFAGEILIQLKNRGIDTAVETNLCVDRDIIREVHPHVDMWLCDLKVFDSELHARWTGHGNETILDNFRWLAAAGKNIIARTTVVPGVNDNAGEISSICDFLLSCGTARYELQPFHTMGFGKFKMLGMRNPMEGTPQQDGADLERLRQIARQKGLNVK